MEHSEAEGLREVPEERQDGVKKFVLDPVEAIVSIEEGMKSGEEKQLVIDSASPPLTTHVLVDDFVKANSNRKQKRGFFKKFRKQYPWMVARNDMETWARIMRQIESIR